MFFGEIRSEVKKLGTTPKDLRKFGFTMAIVLGILALLTGYKGSWSFPYILVLSVAFAGCAVLQPMLLKQIYLGWMTLAIVMGFFMTRVILSILFYSVFSIGGLITRVLKKDLLDQQYDPSAKTYWKPYNKPQNPKQKFEQQF